MKKKRENTAVTIYRSKVEGAQTSVAKGGGLIAKKIIDLARKNGVPVREDRHLIELLSTIDLYNEIPPELYKAIAETLAFINNMSERQ